MESNVFKKNTTINYQDSIYCDIMIDKDQRDKKTRERQIKLKKNT